MAHTTSSYSLKREAPPINVHLQFQPPPTHTHTQSEYVGEGTTHMNDVIFHHYLPQNPELLGLFSGMSLTGASGTAPPVKRVQPVVPVKPVQPEAPKSETQETRTSSDSFAALLGMVR